MGKRWIGLCAALLLPACGDSSSGGGPARPYRMGFTPWLYDATIEARDWVFAKIGAEGDVVSEHLEEGVPWPEMLAGQAFSGSYLAELEGRRSKKPQGQRVLVQINPLDNGRSGLAPYRGAGVAEPLPAPWNGYALDHADVKAAYLNYALRMVEFFEPDYLGIGIEVNLLARNAPAKWAAYVALQRHVYTELKRLHPALTVFASVFCVPFFPEWSAEDDGDVQRAALADLEPYMDLTAFSAHPFMSALLAESFPDDYFDRLFSLTTKPVAIAESSYPAQAWSTLTPPILTFNGSTAKQDAFLRKMLDACDRWGARFVIWFAIRDYDALWAGVLGSSELALVWRDTGLYNEAGLDRPSILTWRAALAVPYAP
jgi:hypothetical protein